MKVKVLSLCQTGFLLLSTLLFVACEKEEEKSYPYVIEYQELAFSPTLWYVLTSSSQNQINQPATAIGYDDIVKNILEEDLSEIPFKRMEFLSNSEVMLTFTDGINFLDTVLTYSLEQNKTKIHFGLTPEEDIIFYNGTEPHTLNLGVISTLYSYKHPDGTLDYSPIVFDYSTELDPIKILNDLRSAESLNPNDTVAVNIAAIVFR
jgi:hypothetical protein